MTRMRPLDIALLAAVALTACTPAAPPPATATAAAPTPFDADQIRAAERRVTTALTAPDVTAWVYEYTEDAVLLVPGEAPVRGRAALLDVARSMKPIASGSIASDRIEGDGKIAYSYGIATWVSGRPPAASSTSRYRQVLVWNREADGVWRIALEAFVPLEPGK